MVKIFDRTSLERELSSLTKQHRVAFAAACAQRNLPNYRVFSEEVSWGNCDPLVEALDYLWDRLEEDGVFSQEKLEDYIRQDDEVTPDLDNFGTDKATYAVDACRTVDHALRSALEDKPLDAAYAGQASFETVDCYIQVTEKMPDDVHLRPELKKKIAEHPLMVRELGRQREDLELLKCTQPLTTAVVMQLRHISQNNGRSNIGLG